MKNNTNNDIVTVLKVVKKGKKFQVITNIDELECLEEQLVDDRIFKGKNFTLNEWEEIKKHQEVSFYFSKTLNYLSYKLRTTKEIIDYLKENNADYSVVKKVIDKL
jgi:regulatory protein